MFGPAGVVEIERPDTGGATVAGLAEAAAATRRALADQVPVVYQAVLFDGAFQGRPDFLVAAYLDPVTGAPRPPATQGRGRSGYEPYDAKLARQARPGAVLQLASYAVALPSAGVPVPEWMHLLQPAPRAGAADAARRPWSAGEDNVVRSFRVDDVAPMVTHARHRLATRLAADPRLPEPSWDEPRPGCATCSFAAHCEQGRERARDLSLVAGLRADQRRKLRAAEITTVEQLAAAVDDSRPAAMSEATFAGP
nr:hypothetical protein [Micromonospora sp. DSM 115978]